MLKPNLDALEYIQILLQLKNQSNIHTMQEDSEDGSDLYHCEIEYFSKKFRSPDIEVKTSVPPQIDMKAGSVRILKGQDIEVECRIVQGYPEPEIKWYINHLPAARFNQVEIKYEYDSQLFRIRNVSSSYINVVSCEAENIKGKDSRSVDIQVHGDGSPKPAIKWFKLDSFNKRIPLKNNDIAISEDGHELKIMHAQQKHDGIYQCMASNEYGEEYAQIALIVVDRDTEIDSFGLITKRTDLHCNVKGDYFHNHFIVYK
uniref:Ig-like domain-containing protein n=1 Tax=Romanomermis culicivorax TaxID=13658 RepID=A0A915KF39_ROMCU